jgi:hypothetical protein
MTFRTSPSTAWTAYDEEEKLVKVPASLDLTPYRDEKDFTLLRRLVCKEKEREK